MDTNKARAQVIVAEFINPHDALKFAKLKGSGYVVTAGINMPFAVRALS